MFSLVLVLATLTTPKPVVFEQHISKETCQALGNSEMRANMQVFQFTCVKEQ